MEMKDVKLTDGEWNEVTQGDIATFENAGDMVEGKLISKREGSKFGNQIYEIKVADGTVKTVYGVTILDQKMAKIEAGTTVRIVYKGEIKTNTGRTAKDFAVFYK